MEILPPRLCEVSITMQSLPMATKLPTPVTMKEKPPGWAPMVMR